MKKKDELGDKQTWGRGRGRKKKYVEFFIWRFKKRGDVEGTTAN